MALVPPLAMGNVPVTPLVKSICAQAGLLLAPVLDKYRVALVSFAKNAVVPAPLWYGTEPCAPEAMLVAVVALVAVPTVTPAGSDH